MRASEREKQEMLEDDLPTLEKKDLPALYISGFLVIALPCLLLILAIVGVTFLLFGH